MIRAVCLAPFLILACASEHEGISTGNGLQVAATSSSALSSTPSGLDADGSSLSVSAARANVRDIRLDLPAAVACDEVDSSTFVWFTAIVNVTEQATNSPRFSDFCVSSKSYPPSCFANETLRDPVFGSGSFESSRRTSLGCFVLRVDDVRHEEPKRLESR